MGAEVTDREVGQRVVTVSPYGSHASMRSVPVTSSWVLPDDVSTEDGACVPIPFGTAADCLFEFGRLRKGETVLVQAASGGVGLAAVQLRNVLLRRGELALLRAAGFRRSLLATMVMLENALLLIAGLGCGLAAATVAVLPHWLAGGASAPTAPLAATLALVLAAGLIAGLIAVRATLAAPLLSALREER